MDPKIQILYEPYANNFQQFSPKGSGLKQAFNALIDRIILFDESLMAMPNTIDLMIK